MCRERCPLSAVSFKPHRTSCVVPAHVHACSVGWTAAKPADPTAPSAPSAPRAGAGTQRVSAPSSAPGQPASPTARTAAPPAPSARPAGQATSCHLTRKAGCAAWCGGSRACTRDATDQNHRMLCAQPGTEPTLYAVLQYIRKGSTLRVRSNTTAPSRRGLHVLVLVRGVVPSCDCSNDAAFYSLASIHPAGLRGEELRNMCAPNQVRSMR